MNGAHDIRVDDELWRLSTAQAQAVLDAFLETQRHEFSKQKIDSVVLDYSLESVVLALKYISDRLRAPGLAREDQNRWFSRLGYYFGEALCRAKKGLSWGLGNAEFAFANHPVITGFANNEEAAVITICRNVILAVALDGVPDSRIENAVKLWFETPVAQ